ncbi:hypothetical protein ACFQ44_01745 [Levilactobacillus lanxiensis]|uniref:Toxin SymE-like domain-containing protein n=1 Tax=Levilactobacillus lanxiensis TaxID=2799568 RepID=A0ABW4D170_9LACO|nr:hypothetical protein [Levilactobacillus lanxiensis]
MAISFAYESDCKPERFPLVKGGNWLKNIGVKKNIIFDDAQFRIDYFINAGTKLIFNVKYLTNMRRIIPWQTCRHPRKG